MSYFAQPALSPDFVPFARLPHHFGFVPNLFQAQTLLPRAIEAQALIAERVLLTERALPRMAKERILLTVAAAKANTYCVALHAHFLGLLGLGQGQVDQLISDPAQADLPEADRALLAFALKLSRRATEVSRADVDALRRHGLSDEHVLEAVLVTALTEFLCTMTVGVGADPDVPLPGSFGRRSPGWNVPGPQTPDHTPGPYVRAVEMSDSFPPFAFFRDRFGFVPNIFRAQTLRPDILEAEAHAVAAILLTEDILTRRQKEFILLVVSAANLNTYCVAVHCELLRALGVAEEDSDLIAADHRRARLSPADSALLDFALTLSERPWEFGPSDIDVVRSHGFSEAQVLEAVVMTALANFLNTVQMGLGPVPDVAPRRTFGGEPPPVNPEGAWPNLMSDAVSPVAPMTTRAGDDPDEVRLVTRAQGGDVEAFGELVQRHHRQLYRTVLGIAGTHEEAEEAVQNAMLKAFQHIRNFEGASRFSTWLTRIGINEALQGQRRHRPNVSIEADHGVDDGVFRPRQLQSWVESPEQLYSRQELGELIEREILKLPPKYRMALLLRDIQQLSAEEAAKVLGLEVANLKTRLHRGRLMLREALAPYLSRAETRRSGV